MTKYDIFDGSTVHSRWPTRRAAFHAVALLRDQGRTHGITVGRVNAAGRILAMWDNEGNELTFVSHGGDHGTWQAA